MKWSKLSSMLGRQRHRLRSDPEESMVSTFSIIVPLYIYPHPDAWEILHQSIRKHPTLHFLVIVNPGNGPGPDAVPDANYLAEIPKLTTYPNVDVVGYVHTTFATRDLEAVMNDISTYSKWAEQTQHPNLGINGIFVDETPNQYDAHTHGYLGDLTRFAKNCSGFGNGKLVIHNPGCAPAPAYLNLADIAVVFEDTWQNFDIRYRSGVFDLQRLFGTEMPVNDNKPGRDKLAVVIHSIPNTLPPDGLEGLIKQAKQTARVLFLTDLDANYYSAWSPRWTDWIDLIATV